MRIIGNIQPKKQETELEKAVRERVERMEQQCKLVDKLNYKLMNFFK